MISYSVAWIWRNRYPQSNRPGPAGWEVPFESNTIYYGCVSLKSLPTAVTRALTRWFVNHILACALISCFGPASVGGTSRCTDVSDSISRVLSPDHVSISVVDLSNKSGAYQVTLMAVCPLRARVVPSSRPCCGLFGIGLKVVLFTGRGAIDCIITRERGLCVKESFSSCRKANEEAKV